MIRIYFLMTLSFLFLSISGALADVYPSFTALRKDSRLDRGRDYEITLLDHGHPNTVMAIHGGVIEPLTEKLARKMEEISGYNLYIFEARYRGPTDDLFNYLHVTATHFDDPDLVQLAQKSSYCISFHEMNEGGNLACIGGRDPETRRRVQAAYRFKDLDSRLNMQIDANENGKGWKFPHCQKLAGTNPENIVNKCERGVQLELSKDLIDELFKPKYIKELNDFLDALIFNGEPG